MHSELEANFRGRTRICTCVRATGRGLHGTGWALLGQRRFVKNAAQFYLAEMFSALLRKMPNSCAICTRGAFTTYYIVHAESCS
eukprot:6200459-Pleurochrysis_carterae.AAC.3